MDLKVNQYSSVTVLAVLDISVVLSELKSIFMDALLYWGIAGFINIC